MSCSTNSDQKSKASLMASKGVACSEESGWTTYLDDFLQSGGPVESIVDSWDHGGSSLISDAASAAAWQIAKHKDMWLSPKSSGKKLSLKKRRTKGALDDDALEDTASSPANSPKVSDMKHFEENPSKKVDQTNCTLEETTQCSQLQINEKGEFCFGEEGIESCNGLRKRGLCLVPLSMLANLI